MRTMLELLGVFIFLLASASAAFSASGQAQGPGSFFFITLTMFLGYCSLIVGAQLVSLIKFGLRRRR